MTDLTRRIDEAITGWWGERCPDQEPGCPICEAWAERDAMVQSASLEARVKELSDQYGIWGEHPDHPLDNWQHETAENYTRLGYWAWVASEIEAHDD